MEPTAWMSCWKVPAGTAFLHVAENGIGSLHPIGLTSGKLCSSLNPQLFWRIENMLIVLPFVPVIYVRRGVSFNQFTLKLCTARLRTCGDFLNSTAANAEIGAPIDSLIQATGGFTLWVITGMKTTWMNCGEFLSTGIVKHYCKSFEDHFSVVQHLRPFVNMTREQGA